MARVENETSEEESEIEVIIEDGGGEHEHEEYEDNESDDEEALEQKVAALEQSIVQNPYVYDDHIALIKLLWKLTELERWRSAFARLRGLSAVAPHDWLEVLNAELTLNHARADNDSLFDLFRQAADDCYFVTILMDWCALVTKEWSGDEARARLDVIMGFGAADPKMGRYLLDVKRRFEETQLDKITREESPEFRAQVERLLAAVQQMVCRPLRGNDAAIDYLEAVERHVADQTVLDKIRMHHEEATEFLNKIWCFEEKIASLKDVEKKMDTYAAYIERVKELASSAGPDQYTTCCPDEIVMVLYDRALTECAGSTKLQAMAEAWARFSRERVPAQYRRVLDACVRRLPATATFWVQLMQQLEREKQPFDQVKEVLERALQFGQESCGEYGALWRGYLEGLRRQTDWADVAAVENVRSTFRLAHDTISQLYGSEVEEVGELLLWWARLEYEHLPHEHNGKEIIEEIFQYGENKGKARYWEALIELERARGRLGVAKLRALHARAVRFVTDYPPALTRRWLELERDHGSLDTLLHCQDVCQAKLKEWKETYDKTKETQKQQKNNKQKYLEKRQKGKADNQKNVKRSKIAEESGEEEQGDVDRRKRRVRDNRSERNERTEKMEVDRPSRGLKRSHDPVNDDAGEESKKSKTDGARGERDDSAGERENANGMEGASPDVQACTLFVSNLDFKFDEPALREKLSQWGNVVRMRVSRSIKTFGGAICYCQYADTQSVEEAIRHDREPLGGRPMFLSRYRERRAPAQFKYSTRPERNKLFVRGLPYGACTPKRLTDLFAPYGTLADVRPVTYKDGKPKGLAYIDYVEEESAQRAIAALDGTEVDGRRIQVAVSAPPPRQQPQQPQQPALGQPKREPTGGMRRTQISGFVPRVLQQPAPVPSSSNQPSTSGDKSSSSGAKSGSSGDASRSSGDKPGTSGQRALTNADFRSMLLKAD